GTRGLLDAPRVAEDNYKQHWRDGKRNQRESPVEIEHHANHADESDEIDQNTQQTLGDETLNGIDVTGHTADQITGPLLVVKGQRQLLDMRVQRPSQVVADPLRHAGSEIFFCVT